ncbi:MAG TPA: hypothetical protein VFZ66_15810 [Herpetosiphonaceae bacterium]
MSTTYRKITPLSIIVCLTIVSLTTAFNAQARYSEDRGGRSTTTTIMASKAQQQASLGMWTREARTAAKPLPLPSEDVAPPNADAAPTGAPSAASSGAADPKAVQAAQAQYPEEWAALTANSDATTMVEPMGTAGVFTSYLGNYFSEMHTSFPYAAVGKLYFTTPGGSSSCSASVISGNNIIVTAAHCVFDTSNNIWYNNWTFVPADRAGAAPFGSFPWASATVLTNWMNASGTDRRYDVAVINLGTNSSGIPVTSYTGWLGRSWNFGSTQHHHAIGYPSNLDSGLYTYICAAESFSGGTDVLGMGCNMTFGSSGGPWIRAFTPYTGGSVNYVNSVVSGGTPGTNTFYGARFNDNNIVLLCNTAGC